MASEYITEAQILSVLADGVSTDFGHHSDITCDRCRRTRIPSGLHKPCSDGNSLDLCSACVNDIQACPPSRSCTLSFRRHIPRLFAATSVLMASCTMLPAMGAAKIHDITAMMPQATRVQEEIARFQDRMQYEFTSSTLDAVPVHTLMMSDDIRPRPPPSKEWLVKNILDGIMPEPRMPAFMIQRMPNDTHVVEQVKEMLRRRVLGYASLREVDDTECKLCDILVTAMLPGELAPEDASSEEDESDDDGEVSDLGYSEDDDNDYLHLQRLTISEE